MQTRWAHRTSPGGSGARLVAAVLPLLGLLAPTAAMAEGLVEIAVCSADGKRVIAVPARKSPARRPEEQQAGCAHFICPRERAHGDLADDDEQ